jgi:F-type H+-transporting ATPase subunit b
MFSMRAQLMRCVLVAVLLNSTAGVALASPEEDASIMDVSFWQSVYTIAVFVILLVILSKLAFKPMLRSLQDRERTIRESLESAERDRAEAEVFFKEYWQRLEDAHQESAELLAEARQDADRVRRQIEAEARRAADDMLKNARKEIALARDSAVQDLHKRSANLAMAMAGEILKRQVSPEDHERLVEDALKQLQQRDRLRGQN